MEGRRLTQGIEAGSPVEVLEKPSSKFATTLAFILIGLSFCLAVFHLYSAGFGQADARLHRSTHLTIMLILTFIYNPLGRKSWNSAPNVFFLVDLILIGLALTVQIYTSWDISDFLLRDANQHDVIIGTICFFLVLEATRRVVGWTMTLIAGFFMVQALFGDHMFGIFYGPPVLWSQAADFLFMQEYGVYGVALMAMSSYIVLFIFFGVLLMQSGAGSFFIDLATSLTGHRRGGAAKTAVVSSAVMGTISGSAGANVVSTGSFTIPLMKSIGYEPKFAGAVEALASSGGQIMPPIMGASAFIIAEFLGLPYIQVVIAAFIPAVLYFFSVFVMVDLEARKKGFRTLNKEDLPELKGILKRGGHLLLPLVTIVALLLKGYTVMMAGYGGIIVTIGITLIKKETRLSPLEFLEAFVKLGKFAVPVAIACACAGLIIGSIHISGVGVRFSSLVIEGSGGILFVALIFTMIASIILGMGLPTVAIYITLSAIVVPGLIKMGVYPMAAHLFVFYFGVMSFVTPPVCVPAFAAAAIAKSNPMDTGFCATRLGLTGFIVPYMFVYGTELLFVGPLWRVLWVLATASIGVISLGGGVQGWLLGKASIFERALLIAGALLLIKPGFLTDIIGFSILGCVLLIQLLREKKSISNNNGDLKLAK